MNSDVVDISSLLVRSEELFAELTGFLALSPYDDSDRISSSRTLCCVSFEHAESVRILVCAGNFTSSLGVLRMQYDALVKSIWALYAATDDVLKRLRSELNSETAKAADNSVPSLGEMLKSLECKAPPQEIKPLLEFKEYSWKPLSSYVHGGIHAVTRHGKGYPTGLLTQAVSQSNGLLVVAGMMLVILAGRGDLHGAITAIQRKYLDCCPPLAK